MDLGKLVEYAIRHARNRNAQSIFLEVRPSNEAAVMLYDSMGFNEIGIRNGYYPAQSGREDALVMALELV